MITQLPDGRFLVDCDGPHCYLYVCRPTYTAAQELAKTHKCPHSNGSTRFAWEITMTLVEKLWQMLDHEYLNLLELNGYGAGDQVVAAQKGKLRGLAEATQLFMSPHFQDADEIVREVVKRYNMKYAGEPYDTPGIGSRIYEMPRYTPSPEHLATASKKASVSERAAASTVTPNQKQTLVKPKVDPETEAAIMGLNGIASAQDIAGIYGIDLQTVEGILAKMG